LKSMIFFTMFCRITILVGAINCHTRLVITSVKSSLRNAGIIVANVGSGAADGAAVSVDSHMASPRYPRSHCIARSSP
jgi:hypothetical protein